MLVTRELGDKKMPRPHQDHNYGSYPFPDEGSEMNTRLDQD